MAGQGADFKALFNTALSPAEEQQFTAWAKKIGRLQDDQDYDIRGAWKELMSGRMAEGDNGHLGDKYKKPNHPTFSDESVYHGATDESGTRYVGGRWIEDEGKTYFAPSQEMLQTTHTADGLRSYMQEREPDVQLVMPDGSLP